MMGIMGSGPKKSFDPTKVPIHVEHIPNEDTKHSRSLQTKHATPDTVQFLFVCLCVRSVSWFGKAYEDKAYLRNN